MAYPWIFESNFEAGDNSEWDSESDTGSLLDFPHYTELARIPGMEVPFAGAYCARIIMGDTNDHTLTEGDIDIADTATAHVRFALYLHDDVAATSDDIFNIFEWQQAGGTVEAVISLQVIAATDVVSIAIADGTEASSGFTDLPKGEWITIEALFTVDVTPGTDGVLTLRVNGGQVQTVTGHNQAAAIGQGVLGTQNTLSTTTGTILLDTFLFDDARVEPPLQRWTDNVWQTKSGHAFVGPGKINNITLLSSTTTADCVLELYDTDDANISRPETLVARLRNTATDEVVDPAGMPVTVTRGAYIRLTGTDADISAMLQIGHASAYGSKGAVRAYGLRR